MIYDEVKAALIKLGWHIDYDAIANRSGELREFIHPVTGDKVAWITAILIQHGELETEPVA